MKVLMIGDVVAKPGLVVLKKVLGEIASQYDFIAANAENSAEDQKGITTQSARAMLDAGCNVLTSGNHYQTRPKIYKSAKRLNLIRPANYNLPGLGWQTNDNVTLINLAGMAMMPPIEVGSFIFAIDEILSQPNLGKIKIIDFHGQAPFEKKALAYYLAGRVSLVVGTHAHAPSADHQIINNQTGFVSDLGMSGAFDSILGYDIQSALKDSKRGVLAKSIVAEDNGRYIFNAVAAEIDDQTGQALSIERVDYKVIGSKLERL